MISAIVITKNEEKMINDCLESLKFCDEIVVVDNSSIDSTVKIARGFTDKIFSINMNDFSEMRNLGKEKARNDWLLYIDADERVSDSLRKKIIKLTSKTEDAGFEIHRKNNFLGRWMEHGGWENEHLLRLMKKDKLRGWYGKLHETAKVDGRIGKIEEDILHFSHRSLFNMVEKTNKWSELEAESRFKNHHPQMTTLRFIKLFIRDFLTRIFVRRAYQDGTVGVIEAIYQPYSLLMTYFKLWEKQL
jgi:glycosyltransferase involved in cell wall biosynthesis